MAELSAIQIAYCVVVMLLAYALRGSAGFGGAVGMPLLALVIPFKLLVPAWTLLGLASSTAILGHEGKKVSLRAFAAFVPWCLVGIAAGLYVFATLDAATLTRGLGVLVLVYAVWTLWAIVRPPPARGADAPPGVGARIVAPAASVLAGTVGTVFGTMGSVFFAMFLDAKGVPKAQFRATVSAMLLVLSAVRGMGYYATGEFTREALWLFAAGFPLMLVGMLIGNHIHVRLSEAGFRKLICGTLFLCGIPLVLQ